MTIYHFCTGSMKDSILREGLTQGGFPIFSEEGCEVLLRYQWLTTEQDPQKQSWATQNMINYSRTEYRLTISIPDSYHKKLIRAVDFVKGMPEKAQEIVTKWAGSEKWYVYHGIIPPKWIVGCHRMEGTK